MHTVSSLCAGLTSLKLPEIAVRGVRVDSRLVQPGDLFVAVSGTQVDGHSFLPQAIERGAVAAVVERRCECSIPLIVVEDSAAALSEIASRFFESRCGERVTIGVTGTNGKTSVSFLLAQALCSLNGNGLYAGTLGMCALAEGFSVESLPFQDTRTTTPDALEFHAFLGAHPGPVAVEVSSIALHQRRLEALELDVAVFTNLTRDHLDYHGTMERYYEAKRELFTRDLKRSGKVQRTAVLSVDSEAGRRLFEELSWCRRLTFSTNGESSDLSLIDAELSPGRTRAGVRGIGGEFSIETRLIGRYNLENLAAVITVLSALGYSRDEIQRAVSRLTPVPGRLEAVHLSEDLPTAIIDYAHTPDALEKAISSVRELTQGRVITLFGCGGDRDRGKRPLMGQVAERLSDLVVVTSDNPRTEPPERILADIEEGLSQRVGVFRELDRRLAIGLALRLAQPGDVVLIAGKGHEPYQEIQGVRHPFLDREVAREALLSVRD